MQKNPKTNRDKFNQDATNMYWCKTLLTSSNTEIQTKIVYKRTQRIAIKRFYRFYEKTNGYKKLQQNPV